jgi:hypothetical protein
MKKRTSNQIGESNSSEAEPKSSKKLAVEESGSGE